ncbi:hypothetical protein SAMN05421823_102588 [Catalinimonas alkaloidigena]|uniref:Pyridoxal phosphate homeostasis protein n=1 Tax=Catalinimonas alkaloidigena TaxID=1075417 RepID=A0A1G9BDT1_9BACT|nr:YggS family pyridoxal phosphate-dependent enzyme [Catalinimonas alkaloidigena]SDK37647.1 hypothetical protein SAMN05421823_102588 [Catalinimonas alkaloidigena]
MSTISHQLSHYRQIVQPYGAKLVAVSKTKPVEMLQEAYEAGQRDFGENKVQEMVAKQAEMPEDTRWHLIGHLQTNKVKYIAPFVHLIHSVDSLKLLREINKQGRKADRVIGCLLQIYIASEETKFGLLPEEARELLASEEVAQMEHIQIRGLMGMATNTDNETQIRSEFRSLRQLMEAFALKFEGPQVAWTELSMGMSGDYQMALEEGSTMIRVGSSIFGAR